MSIRLHVGKEEPQLRVRKGELNGDGPVLRGELSVEERRAWEARKRFRGGEHYSRVVEYDPVLRGHCRLDEEG